MNLRLSVIVLCLLFLASCTSKETGPPTNSNSNSVATSSTSPTANSTAVKSKIDPCSLLTSDEIKAVQGEAFANAMRSDRHDGDFIVGQCYYALPTAVNSVVVNVTTARETAGAPNPKDFWERTFGKEAGEGEGDKDKDKKAEKDKPKKPEAGERREEEGEEGAKPEKVNGLGDEAFWVGSRVGGALYVLKKDLYFRLSIGGAGDERTKLNKSKTLAQDALKRL